MWVDCWCVVAGDLTDQEWERLAPLLPSMAPQRGGRWREHRQVLNGILWRIDNGAEWDQIPERYGPAKTCYDRFARWEQDGTWARRASHPPVRVALSARPAVGYRYRTLRFTPLSPVLP
jgi:transposase